MTFSAVVDFQEKNNLKNDGIVGPITYRALKDTVSPSNKIDSWCRAIQKMEGADPAINNPGNLEYHHQPGTTGQKGRFAVFESYQAGYQALKNLIVGACQGKYAAYHPDGDLTAFFRVYAPSNDKNDPEGYAKFVAAFIGVTVETPIKNLL